MPFGPTMEQRVHAFAAMTTRLTGPLKREIEVAGEAFTVTLTPEGLRVVQKGRRKGHELKWEAFLNGEAALATALNASLNGRT